MLLLLVSLASWSGCRNAPVTQRRQLLIMPEQQEIALGVQAYEQVLSAEQPSTNQRYVAMVERVGKRIAAVANRPDYQWEFRVLASEQQNAFALPGGKTAIYEGILPVCENEAGIAVVMSHEIAHALARHGGERMSQSAVVSGIQQAIGIATQERNEKDRQLLLSVYGAASQYGVLLPYSREHESEADQIGMMLMAKAGYDPGAAPAFWERFAAAKNGAGLPEFFSTHPSDATRAANLRNWLPEARKHYQSAPVKYGMGETIFLPPATSSQ